MINGKLFGFVWLAEVWDPKRPVMEISSWIWGIERLESSFPEWEVWIGPWHFVWSDVRYQPGQAR